MAKAYKKLYGSPTVSTADAVAPIPMDYLQNLYNPSAPSSYYGDTAQVPPEPNGSGPQVGVAAGGGVDTSRGNYYPQDIPQVPVPIAPVQYLGNLPEMGKVTAQIPAYGSEQDAKNDNRNFLIGLSVLGAINPRAVASYVNTGLPTLEGREDRRQASARLAQQQQIAEVGRQYEADKDRYSLGQSTIDKRNASTGAYNTVNENLYGTQAGLHNNYQTQERIQFTAKLRTLADQYKQQVAGVLGQYKNNFGPDAVKALTETANKTAEALRNEGINVSDLSDAIRADSTLSDDMKQKAIDALERTKTQQAGALERVNIMAKYGILGKKMGIEASAKEQEERLQAQREIAEMEDDTRRGLAQMRDATDRFGIDSANTRAANSLALQKWAKERSIDPSSPNGKLYQSLSSQVLDEQDRYNKVQQQITAFRTYKRGADGSPLPGNMVNENGTITDPANKIAFDRLKEQAKASLAHIAKATATMNSLAGGKKASLPINPGFTTGTTANNLPAPLEGIPYPVKVQGRIKSEPSPLPSASPMHPVQTPAKGRAAVKRAQQAPGNTASQIARTGVSKPPAKKTSKPAYVKIPTSNPFSKMSDAEFDARIAKLKKAMRH